MGNSMGMVKELARKVLKSMLVISKMEYIMEKEFYSTKMA